MTDQDIIDRMTAHIAGSLYFMAKRYPKAAKKRRILKKWRNRFCLPDDDLMACAVGLEDLVFVDYALRGEVYSPPKYCAPVLGEF